MRSLIFHDLPEINFSSPFNPRLEYVLNGIGSNVVKKMDHELRSAKTVSSDHPILGMLNSVSARLDEDAYFHYKAAVDMSTEWCAARGITTSSKAARPFKGEILGGDDFEFIYHTTSSLSSSNFKGNALKNWKDFSPLRVIACDYNDSFPWVPGECPIPDNEGIAVFSIDLPMLAMMFRAWDEERMKNKDTETRSQFVRKYVLLPVMRSLMNVKLMNRYYALRVGKWVDSIERDKELALVNYEQKLLKEQLKSLNETVLRGASYPELLSNLHINQETNLWDMIEDTQDSLTAQNRWLMILAEIPLWRLLLSIDNGNENQQYTNRLKRLFFEQKRDRTLYAIRDARAIELIQKTFKDLVADYKLTK